MHCNSVTKSTCRALMVLTVHHFTFSHMLSVAAGCWSDLLPVTVLPSLGAGINCTVYCVVVSHQSCIVFALCVVLLGLQEDVCNNACSLNISLRMWPHCWLCSVFFLFVFLCIVEWKLLTGNASLMHLFSQWFSYWFYSETPFIFL